MRVVFTSTGWEDYTSWADDRKMLHRINRLIAEAGHHPATGVGKPEALGQNLSGYWSRRITDEHRLIYKVADDEIRVAACRYHYGT